MFDTERIGVLGWHEAAKSFGIEIKQEFLRDMTGLNVKSIEKVFKNITATICPFMI